MPKVKLASFSEMGDETMKQVSVGETEILLIKTQGTIHAVAAQCTHQHAPLADGLLHAGRLVCPWHHAVFDVATGELIEPPALEHLASYPVVVEGDDVLVKLPDEGPEEAGQPAMVAEKGGADSRTFVIVGGGAAASAAAQELRHRGFDGRLVMLSDDSYEPYDRTHLSKGFLAGEAPADWLPLKPPEYYVEAAIERISHRVEAVDVARRVVTLPGGAVLEADGLLLAMGAEPRRLEVEGAELDGVMTLRSRADCERLIERAEAAARVVVVGASFIGMEAAASLVQRGVESVTVVAPEEVPFAGTLGESIGRYLQTQHEEHGIDFKLGSMLASLEGSASVREVILDSGQRLAADLVLLGIGVRPATEILQGCDLEDDGSVAVDEHLKLRKGVYAAGDIATFPDWRSGEKARIEHWRVAQQHGVVAARNLLGAEQPLRSVPFFWTMQFGAALGYVGHAPSWDEQVVHGDLESGDFMAYFIRDDRVLAGAALGRDRQLAALHELMLNSHEPTPAALRSGDLDLGKLLAQ